MGTNDKINNAELQRDNQWYKAIENDEERKVWLLVRTGFVISFSFLY